MNTIPATTGRAGFQFIANTIGKARNYVVNALGDMSSNSAALLMLEQILCRIRIGSTFHDNDTCALGSGYYWPLINNSDAPQLGIQGGDFVCINKNAPAYTTINPSYIENPPVFPSPYSVDVVATPLLKAPLCLENITYNSYSPWSTYSTPFPGAPTTVRDGSSYVTRQSIKYPTRFVGGINTDTSNYLRVPLWERVRWISILNTTGSFISSTYQISFTIYDSDIPGTYIKDPATQVPIDVAIYDVGFNIQKPDWNNIWWEQIYGGVTGFTYCPATIIPNGTPGAYTLKINLPSGIGNNWLTNTYWHLLLYFGSNDNGTIDDVGSAANIAHTNTYSSSPTNVDINRNNVLFWPIQNFFISSLPDYVGWKTTGQNNSSVVLFAPNQTHYHYIDGQYLSNPPQPVLSQYDMPSQWPIPSGGNVLGSLQGITIPNGCALPILAVIYTGGEPSYVIGPIITPEFWPTDWNDCSYFPAVPDSYTLIAKLVLVNSSSKIVGSLENSGVVNLLSDPVEYPCTCAIAWIEMAPLNFETPTLNDRDLILYFLPIFQLFVSALRSNFAIYNMRQIAYSFLIPILQFSSLLNSEGLNIANPNSLASQVVHGWLKQPIGSNWLPSDPDLEPLAVSFDQYGEQLIEDLTGQAPSTEIVHLDADNLYLTGKSINIPNTFELYMAPAPLNLASDADVSSSLGQDYTFRFVLEDGSQNTLTKDWLVMASNFYLTDAQYVNQSKNGTVIGYYTADMLINIDDWRLQGYAIFVPDLFVGNAVPLNTLLVAPPDDTKTTEEQFIDNLEAQNYTQSQINEAIIEYTNDEDNTFYVVDLDHYPNLFTTCKSVSVSVAQYAYTATPSWQFDLPSDSNSVSPYCSDSFIIAPQGQALGSLESSNTHALGCFNYSLASNLPGPNTERVDSGLYIVNGWWAYTADTLPSRSILQIYPRAYLNDSVWQYAPYYNDIYVCVRVKVDSKITDFYTTLYGLNTLTMNEPTSTPVTIVDNDNNPIYADSIVYLAVSDTSSDSIHNLNSSTHGAPPGDRLVLRSA